MVEKIYKFLQPPRFADDEDKTRVASLLNGILLLTIALMALVILTVLVTDLSLATILTNTVILAVPLGLLFLMRRGYVREAASLFVSLIWLLVSAVAYWGGGLTSSILASYFVLIVLAAVLAGPRMVVVITAVTLLMTAYIEILFRNGLLPEPVTPYNPLTDIVGTLGTLILLAIIMFVTIRGLDKALTAQRESNEALNKSQATLEARVADRTKNLQLAAEIGRGLIEVRDLETLLSEAAQKIRDYFDLYYVQIYLINLSRHSLILSAGSGEIGRDLVRRGHRLVMGPGSINGIAATRKESMVVSDTAVSPLFKPNPYLPDTRSELAVPLLVGEELVGVLNIQNNTPYSLTTQDLPVYEMLGGQLAVAIENARLFSKNRQMQTRLETEIRQVIHEGWSDYLDALAMQNVVGFTHDGRQLYDMSEAPPLIGGKKEKVRVPISIQGEMLGEIEIVADASRPLTPVSEELVRLVSQQVASQLEHLRLLSETERYRAEAEAAVNRLTQQHWHSFATDLPVTGYVYEQSQLKPIPQNGTLDPALETGDIQQPLGVHGKPIGTVVLEGVSAEEADVDELLTAVSGSLSAHLENLRLTEQTEKALAETKRRAEESQAINRVAELVARQTDRTKMLTAVLEQIQPIIAIDAFLVGIYDAVENLIEYPLVYDEGEFFRYPPAAPLTPSRVMEVIHNGKIITINRTPAEVAALSKEGSAATLGQEQKISASLLYVPLQVGERIFGVLSIQSYSYNAFSEADISLLTGIANYLAIALDNARLLAEFQKQARQEQILREITTRVHTAVDAESILRTAAKEIRRTLGVEAFVYLDDPQADAGHVGNGEQVKANE